MIHVRNIRACWCVHIADIEAVSDAAVLFVCTLLYGFSTAIITVNLDLNLKAPPNEINHSVCVGPVSRDEPWAGWLWDWESLRRRAHYVCQTNGAAKLHGHGCDGHGGLSAANKGIELCKHWWCVWQSACCYLLWQWLLLLEPGVWGEMTACKIWGHVSSAMTVRLNIVPSLLSSCAGQIHVLIIIAWTNGDDSKWLKEIIQLRKILFKKK